MGSPNRYLTRTKNCEIRDHLKHYGNYLSPDVTLLQPSTLRAQFIYTFRVILKKTAIISQKNNKQFIL